MNRAESDCSSESRQEQQLKLRPQEVSPFSASFFRWPGTITSLCTGREGEETAFHLRVLALPSSAQDGRQRATVTPWAKLAEGELEAGRPRRRGRSTEPEPLLSHPHGEQGAWVGAEFLSTTTSSAK